MKAHLTFQEEPCVFSGDPGIFNYHSHEEQTSIGQEPRTCRLPHYWPEYQVDMTQMLPLDLVIQGKMDQEQETGHCINTKSSSEEPGGRESFLEDATPELHKAWENAQEKVQERHTGRQDHDCQPATRLSSRGKEGVSGELRGRKGF